MPLPPKFYVQPDKLTELEMLKKALEFESAKAKQQGKSVQTTSDELKNTKKRTAMGGITAGVPGVANSAENTEGFRPGRKRELGSYNNSVFDKLGKEYDANSFGAVGASAFDGALTELEDLWQFNRQINDAIGNPLTLLTGKAPEETARLGNEEVRQQYKDDMPTINKAGSWLPDVVGGLGAKPGASVAKGAVEWLGKGQGQYLDDIIRQAGFGPSFAVPPSKKAVQLKKFFDEAKNTPQDTFDALMKKPFLGEGDVTNKQDLFDWAKNNIDDLSNEQLGAVYQQGSNMRGTYTPDSSAFSSKSTSFSPDAIADMDKVKDNLKEGRPSIWNDPYSRAKKIASGVYGEVPLSDRGFDKLKNEMVTQKPTYFTRYNGRADSSPYGHSSATIVDNPNSIDDINANQYLEYGDGDLFKAPAGSSITNMLGNGQVGEIVVPNQLMKELTNSGNSRKISEVNSNLKKGIRILGAGGGLAGGIGLLDLLQSIQAGNEEL